MDYLKSEEDSEGNGESWFYDKRGLLQQIDRLRRYFCSKVHRSGAPREQLHWKYYYFIIVDVEDLNIGGNSRTGKGMGPDPVLEGPAEEYDTLIDEMAGASLQDRNG